MVVQKRDKTRIPSLQIHKARDVVHDVERIRPFVALCPAVILSRPRAVCVARLHEAGVGIEDGAVRRERAREEEREVCEVGDVG